MMTQHIQEWLRRAGFIWADKVALFVGFLFLSFFLYLWSLAFFIVGPQGAAHMWGSFGMRGLAFAALVTGLAWFVLRGIDFFAGGHTCRLIGHKFAIKDLSAYWPFRQAQGWTLLRR